MFAPKLETVQRSGGVFTGLVQTDIEPGSDGLEVDLLKLRQPLFVLAEHLLHHLPDLRQRQLCGGEWVMGDGLIHQLRVTLQTAIHGHHFDLRTQPRKHSNRRGQRILALIERIPYLHLHSHKSPQFSRPP